MEDSGQLTFGVWTGTTNTITSPQSYNDGGWHHLVADQSADGMKLYVDGQLVGTHPQTAAQGYSGYWRVGGDTAWGGSSHFFDGTIDEVAVYSRALSQSTITSHYLAGGGQLPNQSPTAAFTVSRDDLEVTADGSGSADADGSIASYEWNWGDGSSPDHGSQVNHTYAHSGTFTVTLTVTDDDGATATTSQDVTVEHVNKLPSASFTISSPDGLAVGVDGSASSDPDGSIASYGWSWGDGSADSTGSSPSHTYGASNTYTITLTVTDNEGGTATQSKQVTVSSAPIPLLQDSFSRTVVNGWGSPDTGGAWTRQGTASNFAVSGGQGSIRMGSAGSGPWVSNTSFSATNTDMSLSVGIDKVATGGGVFIMAQPRLVAGSDGYVAEPKYLSSGAVQLLLFKSVGGTDTTLSTTTVPGLSVAPGDRIMVRAQVFGTSPTTVRAKIWKVGTSEPAAWTSSITDSTAAIQVAGGAAVRTYLSGSATNAPVIATFDDVWVGPLRQGLL